MKTPLHILMTGANGFLGSYLLKAFLQQGYKLTVIKRDASDLWRIKDFADRVTFYDVEDLAEAFDNNSVDVVVHTACHYGRNGDSVSQIVETNLNFSLKLLELAVANKVPTFVNTDSLLPRELNVYALSKKQFVDWLAFYQQKIQVINLKLEHMYGPLDDSKKFVSWIIEQFAQNVEKIDLTKGEQLRDFVYIDDIVSAFCHVIKVHSQLDRYSEFGVGSGQLTSVRHFVEQLKMSYQKYCDNGIKTELNFGAIDYRQGELMSVDVDIQPLKSLGWNPVVDLDSGLEKLIKENK